MKIAAWMATESWFRPPTAICPKMATERHFELAMVAKARRPTEGMDEEADTRPMPEPWMQVWAGSGVTAAGSLACRRSEKWSYFDTPRNSDE